MTKKYETLQQQQQMSEEEYLAFYKTVEHKYESPSISNDIVVFTIGEIPSQDIRKLNEKHLETLLVKRNQHPEMGKWALIGGFMPIDKTFDDNVSSILKDKLNIENVYTEQLYSFNDVNRDKRKRIISSSYMTLTPKSKFNGIRVNETLQDFVWSEIKVEKVTSLKSQNSDEIHNFYKLILTINETEEIVSELKQIVKIDGVNVQESIEVVKSDLAFDHAKIIFYAYLRLQGKLSYTNIAFNLVDKYFTLTEIQSIYEIILEREFHKSDFRRIIKPMVLETEKKSETKGHRPSKLFKYNPEWSMNIFK